jgi:ERCC4-related helicase
MEFTAYHAQYFAYELTRKRSADDIDKLTASLQDAKVDMNPHQVEAALFAFKSPLSKGALLADEVGLGKTIEAGIILSQKWAERNRKLLIIAPANLRKQWNQELIDKFYLPSLILESKSFNQLKKANKGNPFEQDSIVICSYQFAKSKDKFLKEVVWDLVVIDEAHRLRNVYKPDNKIANSIKTSLENFKKVLLTATPLQNSLMELYGLVSIIDPYIFGDISSYRALFSRLTSEDSFDELKMRLTPVCIRTLRRQVLEYIRYTNRIAMVEEFTPFKNENILYDQVSKYLQREKLYALPTSIRPLITLILRKLLSSSSFAIQGTLEKLSKRLESILERHALPINQSSYGLDDNFEIFDEYQEEWGNEEELPEKIDEYTEDELFEIEEERNILQSMADLAQEIKDNAKGHKLITALEKGFEKLEELDANKKAIIFTESRRTQQYITTILEENGYDKQIVLFNGTNDDQNARMIYMQWYNRHKGTDKVTGSITADTRQALVEYFRDYATIMIATEAAAEGINLQFCSLVVNYDLPWNPQRIEQRIGRCHRYGQLHDVVVINFLNKSNAADQRVYQLLDQKFQLFSGVFGASDEVLGSIESGVDFEQRIAAIYQECRQTEEIQEAFDKLQEELAEDITDKMTISRKQLLENFDEDVSQKLRFNRDQGIKSLSQFEQWLWNITHFYIRDYASFHLADSSFILHQNPFPGDKINPGKYRLIKHQEGIKKSEIEVDDDASIYRIGHPLSQKIIEVCKADVLPPKEVVFDYTNSRKKITLLENMTGCAGWLQMDVLTIESYEKEEHLLIAGFSDQGKELDAELCKLLFSIEAGETQDCIIPHEINEELCQMIELQKADIEEKNKERDSNFFGDEYDKLDKWADDMKLSLEKEIKDIDAEIKLRKAEAAKIFDLQQKVSAQRAIKELEKKRSEKRKKLFESQDEIDARKEEVLSKVEARMQQTLSRKTLFTIRWNLV